MPEAIDSAKIVARSLSDDVYLLLPEDGRRHFVGEAVLIGIGAALLSGFVAGVTATLKDRAKEWGASASEWLLAKIEHVLSAEDAEAEGTADLETEVAEAVQTAADQNTTPDWTFVTQVVVVTLNDSGFSDADARRTAESVRTQAGLLLAQAGMSHVSVAER